MKIGAQAIAVLLSIILSACAVSTPRPSPVISLVSLLADPDRFNGKKVQTVGILSIAEEESVLYISRDDFDEGVFPNSIWLDLDDASAAEDISSLSGQYVVVDGEVSSHYRGYLSVSAASIIDIDRIEPWAVRPASEETVLVKE